MDLFTLKKIISDILTPLPFFLILGLSGLLRITFVGRGFFSLFSIFIGFLGIFIAAFSPITEGLQFSLEKAYLKKQDPKPGSFYYIHVLGHDSWQNPYLSPLERLSSASLRRTLEGVRLYKKHPGTKLVFSGGFLS